MDVTFLIAGMGVGGFLIGAVGQLVFERFQKPKTTPNHARLIAKPGATLDLVDEEGVIRAKVILINLTHDRLEGTSATFVDYFQYKRRNTYHG